MIVTRSDIKSFTRFAPKLALAGAAILILSAFAQSSDAAVFTAREGDAPLEFTLPAHETTMAEGTLPRIARSRGSSSSLLPLP